MPAHSFNHELYLQEWSQTFSLIQFYLSENLSQNWLIWHLRDSLYIFHFDNLAGPQRERAYHSLRRLLHRGLAVLGLLRRLFGLFMEKYRQYSV